MDLPSTKPYFLRALYEWCCDHHFTPYLTVVVDSRTEVPTEHVRDGQITLNIGPEATSGLRIDAEWISFAARFGGVARNLLVPVDRVAAIYARENGAGMGFEVVEDAAAALPDTASQSSDAPDMPELPEPPEPPEPPAPPAGGGRPKLQRVK